MVVGAGEVGSAIIKIEQEAGNTVYISDINSAPSTKIDYDVMNICIPYSDKFEDIITDYINTYNPTLTIIHSTVKVGTTHNIQKRIKDCYIVHSYVRGVHPHLYEGIKTFTKYVGSDYDSAKIALKHYLELGLHGHYLGTSKESELAKLMSTMYYGWNILFAKETKRMCNKFGLDYTNVYTIPNLSYNSGYTELRKENVVRPVLTPPSKKILGHCVSQNVELLPETLFTDIFKELNEYDLD